MEKHIGNERETHKACCRGEEKPAVFDDRAGAIANHVLYVVIETVCTYNQRETQWRLTSISNNSLCQDALCFAAERRKEIIIFITDRKT